MVTAPASPQAPRARRWLRYALLGVAAALAAVALAVVAVARSLDRPWVKGRVQALARARGGVELDYGRARLWTSGLLVEELVVRAPPRFRAAAPDLARVGALEARWSLRSLLRPGPLLDRLALRDVELTVVREGGASSLAEVGGPPGPAAAPTAPSRILGEALGTAPGAARVVVERAAVTLVLRDGGGEERLRLAGLALEAEAARAGAGWRVGAQAGAAAPLLLALTRQRGGRPAGEAALRLALTAAAWPGGAEVNLDLSVESQTLAPVTMRRVARIQAAARCLPSEGRTALTLAQAELADGAATVAADVELPDAAGAWPLLRRGHGAIDLPRLLGLLPPGLVPLQAREARLRYDIAQLTLAPLPRLGPGGRAVVEATVAELRAPLPGGALAVPGGHLALQAEPAPEGATALTLSAPLGTLQLDLPGGHLAASAVTLDVAGRVAQGGAWTGSASVGFRGLERTGAQLASARDGRLELKADGLRIDDGGGRERERGREAAAAVVLRGRLELSGQLGQLILARPGLRAEATGVGWSARTHLSGAAPYAGDLSLPVERLRLLGAGGRPLFDGRARLDLQLSDVTPDAAEPRRSRGVARASVELGELRAQLGARKREAAVEYTLSADASSLALARALAPPGPAREVAWEQLGLALRSSGKVEQLGSPWPRVDHRTELQLDRPRLGRVAARRLALVASSRGTARRHEGDADLRVTGLGIDGREAGDGHLTLSLQADAAAPSLRLRAASDGSAAPAGSLSAQLAYDRARRVVSYDLDGRLADLAALRPVLAALKAGLEPGGLELAGLELGLRGRGTAAGLVEAVGPGGAPRLAADPLATLAVDGDLELRAAGLRYRDGDRAVRAPSLSWRGELRSDGPRRLLRGALHVDELHIASGVHQIDIADVRDRLDVTMTGDLRLGEGEVAQQLTMGELRQDLAPGYPLRDVKFSINARRTRDGIIRVPALQLDNPAGGTSLKLRGGLDFGDQRRSLTLRGDLTQKLARLWTAPADYRGRGDLSLSLRVESGNLTLYHVLASLRVKGGDLLLPRRHVAVEGLEGEVPVAADVLLTRAGPRLLRDAAVNAYSELRFADQHPLLDRRSFMFLRRLATPLFTLAPLAGNLKIENNIVSLSQLEAGFRGGQLSGQCLLDWRERGATVQLNVRASDVRSAQGERFDGNSALVLTTRDRGVEGRAEILRIGRRHLLELLDLHDPHHADPSVNTVRRALAIGYPERVRLSFDHGFASARMTFGGLGRLVRVSELRGIPLGPIIDRVTAGALPREDSP